MELKLALKVSNVDNVATVFANGVKDGDEIEIRDKKGNNDVVKVIGDIPYGHKIATRDIHVGEDINKYGEEIGIATHEIMATMKPAPAETLRLRTATRKPLGAPSFAGSSEKEYCVFAIQIGRLPKPSSSSCFSCFAALPMRSTPSAR